MNELIITALTNSRLIEHARTLPQQGILKLSTENLLYVDIDDRYIDDLCPLLNDLCVQKPDYFSIGIGSHISVIYPNEFENPTYHLGALISFEIDKLFRAETAEKIYFALSIYSPEIFEIRSQNNLHHKLNLNGWIVHLHTTIGVFQK